MQSRKPHAYHLALLWALLAATVVRSEVLPGDADGDADRDLADFAQLANCQSSALPSCDLFRFSPDLPIDRVDFSLFACGFGGPGKVVASVTAEAPISPTPHAEVTLIGTTAGATQVRVSGGLQTVTVPADGCDFSMLAALRPNAVNNLYITAIFGNGAQGAPLGVSVAQDEQAPTLFIDFPLPGAQIIAANTDVAGRVGDTLSGFTGLRAKVAVNDGLPVLAAIDIGVGANGTYFLPSVPLELGQNTITVSAVDALGNFIERQISVTRVEVPPGTPRMNVLSGNGQSAPIHDALPQPIAVQVLGPKGTPLEGKLVSFSVVRSDGRLASSSSGLFPGAAMFQAFTDSQGVARAFWRLGSDAGRGNNRVEVTSDGILGTTIFCASATAGPAAQINVGGGNNQRVEAGAAAPLPLDAWVNDACNPVSGVPVTFTVRQGGGKVDGLNEITIDTAASGHAAVNFTLGPAGGNNVVEATFDGNPNPPAVFTLVGVVRDATKPTTFSGLVLDNAGQPIQGATCALVIGGTTLPFERTDLDGRFHFADIPLAGPADVHVTGATATHVGGLNGFDVPLNSFPALRYSVIVVANAANALPAPVLLPRMDAANTRLYSTTADTELTIAGMEGLKMVVKAGSMRIRSGGQFVPAPNGTAISLNQVHHDDVPMPLPDGAAPPFAWTLQPGGAQFDPPITVHYPNMSGLPAGAIANFLSFNHDTGRFEIIASGHVTEDGTTIVTDPGAGISVAGWGCNCPPYSVTGQCCHCHEPCQQCEGGACVATGNGAPCGDGCCGEGQACCDGHCVAADLTCCEGGNTCPAEEACCQGDCCVEGAVCCENGCCLPDQECCGGNCISALNICCDNGVECFPEFPMCCGQGCCVADGVCCDDQCQPPGTLCCGTVNCSPPTPQCCGDQCCAEDAACCNGNCAPAGSHCCDDGTTVCSPPNTTCCDGGVCISGDQQCCQGEFMGGVCSATTEICCGGACCSINEVCCQGECHPAGTECCNLGQACEPPTSFCCGPACCEPSEKCCDVACWPADYVCCERGAPCDAAHPICCGDQDACCSTDQQCCDGQCVPQGDTCCPGRVGCPAEAPVCCGEDSCCDAGHYCCDNGCHVNAEDCCNAGSTCTLGGGTCCNGTACCGEEETCCEGTCCAAGETCCNGHCCPEGQSCCEDGCTPTGGECCSDGHICSGDFPRCCGVSCCAYEAVCCGEQCAIVGSTCCEDGRVCSPPTQECCGESCCCRPGETCCAGASGCSCVPGGHACP